MSTAIEKLKKELVSIADKRLSRQAKAMAAPVEKMLESFCGQDSRFAEAVEGCPKTLTDCMEAVSKGVTYEISDVDAYRRAVQFYVPGAEVDFRCLIVLPSAKDGKKRGKILQGIGQDTDIISVSLDDLLG